MMNYGIMMFGILKKFDLLKQSAILGFVLYPVKITFRQMDLLHDDDDYARRWLAVDRNIIETSIGL